MAFAATVDQLIAEAKEIAGSDDLGPDDYREGLDRLVAELSQIGLTAQGEAATRGQIVNNLVARLKAVDGFKARPDAMGRPIKQPLVITGIVRSGTTALHKLLSMDRQFQGPEHWLCAAPQPRPPRDAWESNPDYRKSKATLDAMIEVAPEILEDHGMSVDDVEESLNVLSQSFCSNMYGSQCQIPEYDAWYRATDDRFSYAYFADVLRLIGADAPDRRWLLKNPTDTFSMQQVLDVFPDAMIVQTHRDPLQSVPSVCNLLGGAQRLFSGANADPARMFAREQEMWALAMERAEAVKETVPGQVMDVQFGDFVRDQMGVVARIYDRFGLTLTAEAEDAMRGWLAAHPRRSTTLHRFTPEDFGGSTAALLERYKAYRERYGYAA